MTWRHRDRDDDGLVDGQDVEFIEHAVSALPPAAFKSAALPATFITRLEAIELPLLKGQRDDARLELGKLALRVDGCGAAATGTIGSCSAPARCRSAA
jgi:hypothetical protein